MGELGRFLAARRARLRPDQVGLPAGPRRRVPGLRREEVAVLAHISPAWYAQLEQGRSVTPSHDVLESIADALRLDRVERRYLHALAHPRDGAEHDDATGPGDPARAVAELDAVVADLTHPAYLTDRNGTLVSWNAAADDWYAGFAVPADAPRNIVWWMFTSPDAPRRLTRWGDEAHDLVARTRFFLRFSAPGSAAMTVVDALCARCPEFRRSWESYDVVEQERRHRAMTHPERGPSTFRLVVLRSAADTSASLVIHLPEEP